MKKVFLIILSLLLFQITAEAKSFGIGIEAIRKGSFEDFFVSKPLQIRSIQSGSPAAKAGIPENWYIISINGKNTSDLTEKQCLSLLNNSDRITLKISPQEISTALNETSVNLSNIEGFTNIVKYVPKRKGIGISIYKYPLNLSMPILITNIEHGSPAELFEIHKNSIIQKINGISTIELSEKECLKIINNSKSLTLEITDLEGNNSKIYTLQGKDYFQSDIKRVEKDGILSKAILGFTKYNSIENLLFEYFQTLSPNYVRTSKKTNKEISEEDIKKIEEPYLQYKSNPNDITFNKNLYDGLNTFIKQYKELKWWHIETVKNILVYYGKVNSTASEQEVLNYIKNSGIDNKDYYLDKISFYESCISIWDKHTKEIYNYSIAYEKKQKLTTVKSSTPYFVDRIDFRDILWGVQKPKVNGMYSIPEGVRVIQSVKGGVLANYYSDTFGTNMTIYIGTNKEFADGSSIQSAMAVVFEGYYTYTNTLGASRKIYKFKEVPISEYKSKVISQKYYFIN